MRKDLFDSILKSYGQTTWKSYERVVVEDNPKIKISISVPVTLESDKNANKLWLQVLTPIENSDRICQRDIDISFLEIDRNLKELDVSNDIIVKTIHRISSMF
jgi:hypothetical protein